jgi:hypothetical protein
VVDRGFKPRLDQTKDYTIGIFCFSTKHTGLRSKIKQWLDRYQDNVSEWSNPTNIIIMDCCFKAKRKKIQPYHDENKLYSMR